MCILAITYTTTCFFFFATSQMVRHMTVLTGHTLQIRNIWKNPIGCICVWKLSLNQHNHKSLPFLQCYLILSPQVCKFTFLQNHHVLPNCIQVCHDLLESNFLKEKKKQCLLIKDCSYVLVHLVVFNSL